MPQATEEMELHLRDLVQAHLMLVVAVVDFIQQEPPDQEVLVEVETQAQVLIQMEVMELQIPEAGVALAQEMLGLDIQAVPAALVLSFSNTLTLARFLILAVG